MKDRRWNKDFDRYSDQALSVFDDTAPLPLFGALLYGPASELDAVPMPQPAAPPSFWQRLEPYLVGAAALALLELATAVGWRWTS